MRSLKRLAALSGIAAIAFAAGLPPTAAAATEHEPQTLDELFDLFDVGDFPADFVIVIDTSGSMSQGDNPLYPAVVDSFGVLVDSIPAGDFVSVVTFDSDPNIVFQGTLQLDSRTAARSATPEIADGTHTDIGSAIDATLRRLERADSSDVQTVVFITDGLHDPPDGSGYSEKTGESWENLRDRATRVEQTHDLTVLGIGLVEGTDIELLRSVFSNPEIISLPPGQLSDFFEDAVRQSRLARLRFRVDNELDRGGVRLRSTTAADLTSAIETTVTLTSEFNKLPIAVEIDGVVARGSDGTPVSIRLIGESTVSIPPTGSVEIPVLLQPEIQSPHFTIPPTTEAEEFTIEIDAHYTVEPRLLLGRVTAHPLGAKVTGAGFVETRRTFGWTVTQAAIVAGAGLLTLLILIWLYRRFMRLPSLVGVFELEEAGLDQDSRVIKLRRKRMVLDGTNIPLAGNARLRLFTKRGYPGHVWASVEQPPFYEVASKFRERQIHDSAEIRFGRYRLGNARMKYLTKPSSRTKRPTKSTGEPR